MPWTTPSFEEIKMDAEARGYGIWVDDAEATQAVQQPSADSPADPPDDGSAA